PLNPRNFVTSNEYQRGEIIAADGTVLAKSVATGNRSFPWRRKYPLGDLTAGVVGFSSTIYGEWALEAQYGSYLEGHSLPPQSVEQLLAPSEGADSVTLTLQLALQKIAEEALAGRDGSVVALDPRTGAVLAMYSNPTFNPAPFTAEEPKVQTAAWKRGIKKDVHGYPPLGLVATQQTIFPGSTFKVITTAGLVKYNPALLTKYYKPIVFTKLPDSNKPLYNDGDVACGGTVAEMLPQSCDPGYALLGLALGAQDLTATAQAFGYNQIPPLDLPGVVASFFPKESYLAANPPFLAYSAIGQQDVSATALQNALVAAGIADGGKIMTPHLMSYTTAPDGSIDVGHQVGRHDLSAVGDTRRDEGVLKGGGTDVLLSDGGVGEERRVGRQVGLLGKEGRHHARQVKRWYLVITERLGRGGQVLGAEGEAQERVARVAGLRQHLCHSATAGNVSVVVERFVGVGELREHDGLVVLGQQGGVVLH